METKDLDEVETYMLKRAGEVPGQMARYELKIWIRYIFAELRAREEVSK